MFVCQGRFERTYALIYIKTWPLCLRHLSEATVAQSVERVTPGEEVVRSIPAVDARCLPVGSMSV